MSLINRAISCMRLRLQEKVRSLGENESVDQKLGWKATALFGPVLSSWGLDLPLHSAGLAGSLLISSVITRQFRLVG